jgi:uncharacterized membrane-anchored protein YitT (DUF2179 family)
MKKIVIKILKLIQIYFFIIFGSSLIAIAINLFLVPNKIAAGGVSGIATIIYYLSNKNFPVGMTMLILNIPLFIIGIRAIGKVFIIRTLFSTVYLSVAIDFLEPITNKIYVNYLSFDDIILYAIFGGVIMGVGLGLIIKAGATSGGTDMAAVLVSKMFKSLTVGQILLFIDACVIVSSAIAFKSIKLSLYALISLYVATKAIDFIVEGVSFVKAVYIISDDWESISNKVLTQMDRGITAIKSKGMFTNDDRMVLLCIINRNQVYILKEIVKSIDKNAFVFVNDVREVLGEGFENHEHI